MQFEFITSIHDVEADAWDALWSSSYPFTRHAFFSALETSNSTNAQSGWQPMHCIAKDEDTLVFAMPLFVKTHSYGEYVFDWAWADAYARAGLDYYPKLLNAIPFTPATGPRLACLGEQNELSEEQLASLQKTLEQKANSINASSIHCLFPDTNSMPFFKQSSYSERQGSQYHWFNRGYESFDDFLGEMSSRKRKNIKKERAKCNDYKIIFKEGADTSEADWTLFYQLYHRTYLKRSGRPGYLGARFFIELAANMPEHIVLALAEYEGATIAGAVYFRDDTTLYGRYWGTLQDIDGLHFETCYYRGIEYAIEHKLQRFDPGAQGEHKIQRGFQPVATCSFHWLNDARFQSAVEEFCQAEKRDIHNYIDGARDYLPFKEGTELTPANCLVKPTLVKPNVLEPSLLESNQLEPNQLVPKNGANN